MRDVDFDLAKTAVPITCFTMMKEFPAEVQRSVGEQSKELAQASMSGEANILVLGIYMIQQVGSDVLARAVKTLDYTLKAKPNSDG